MQLRPYVCAHTAMAQVDEELQDMGAVKLQPVRGGGHTLTPTTTGHHLTPTGTPQRTAAKKPFPKAPQDDDGDQKG